MRRRAAGRSLWAPFTACTAGVALMIGGVSFLSHEFRAIASAEHAIEECREEDAREVRRKWDELRAINPDTVAWLTVGQTSINTPVVAQTGLGEDGWYLSHDYLGEESEVGCPYLDDGMTEKDCLHLVFGHHIAFTTLAFSELNECWSTERFGTLGACTWETPQSVLTLRPLCALLTTRFDQQLALARERGPGVLGTWLEGLCERSNARAQDWRDRCASAREAVALVTCASLLPNQDERTVVVFA